MSLRVHRPEYGGAFLTDPETPAAQPVQLRFVLPNELVEPTPAQLHILQPSPDRVTPGCRHFGVCGGCDYQHAAYPAQVALKLDILHQTLYGLTHLPPIQPLTSHHWHYRNRIRLRVETIAGHPRVGYNRRATRDFLPIAECPIAAPLLWRAAEAITALAQTNPAITRWLPSIAEIEFEVSEHDDALGMLVLTRDARTEGFAAFCEALAQAVPELTGAGTLAASAGFGAKERATWGSPGIAHTALGRTFWVTRGGFFQVNRFLTRELAALVTGQATRDRTGDLAWDLYAGVGLFSRILADSFQTVVAVESAPTAAADLTAAIRQTPNLQAIASDTAAFLTAALLQRERPSLIVMDPPRAGLGPEVCALLARVAAPELVYVSCDPTTLARDLRLLLDSGYRITGLHLLDMFPQTFHIETVVFLRK